MKSLLEKPHPHIFVLVVAFLLQFLFISPIGEFALNDDWVHTEIMKHWVDSGEFRMNPFSGPTFYVPIMYGAVLTKIFGFSFSMFRISTLVLGILTLILFYKLATEITQKPRMSFYATLLLWCNPIFYSLTFTYMTDIPGLFLIIAGLFSYLLGFKQKNPWCFLLGSVLAIIGMYTRQTNILILAAAGLFSLTQLKHIKFRHLLWSFGIPLLAGAGIYYSLHIHHLLPESLDTHNILGGKKLILKNALWWTYYTFMYMGFFALPFAAAWFVKNIRFWKHKLFTAYSSLSIILMLIIRQVAEQQFPYVSNIFNIYTLGPVQGTLYGAATPMVPSMYWGILTLFVAASSGWVLSVVHTYIKKQFEEKNNKPEYLLYIFAFLFTLPILIFISFDRYFLPLFAILAILIATTLKESEFSKPILYISLIVFMIFNITQTKFYLKLNELRWETTNEIFLTSELPIHAIDGGYEWNGMYSYWSANAAKESGITHGPGNSWWIRHLFVNNTMEYRIGIETLENYTVEKEIHIPGKNPNNTLYLLKKDQNL